MSEIIYLNRDNQIILELRTNESLVDLSGLTRAILVVGTTTLDSATVSGYFDWTDTGYGTGTLIIDVGSATITEGYYNSYLIVYDNTNPNGIVWGKKFTIIVEDI
jgi:hypothetical protein